MRWHKRRQRPAAQSLASKTLRHSLTLFSLVLALGLLPSPPVEAAGMLVADGPFGGALEIEEHSVEVTINNGIAVTEVTQVFRNTEDRVAEALYTFPVPHKASVANFSMWINGEEMVGEVVEKERARQIYNSYKRRGQDPGLLEQNDYKTFEMRIFPIPARAEQRVQVAYYQELEIDHDWATWVYPLATVTQPGVDARVHGRFSLNLDVRSEIPIKEMESPSHGDDFVVARHSDFLHQASLETTGGSLRRDLVITYRLSRPRTGVDLIASNPPGEDGYFLMTLTTGEELKETERGMDYVFVLDISGSMDDDGKLALSRGSIDAFLRELGDADRFEVLTFNVAADALFSRLESAETGTLGQAERFLASRQARGGTILRPALETAYGYKDPDRPLNVVLLSDGMTQQGERATLLRAIQERPSGTRVFAIGVGNEVNRPLLEQLAEDAGGLAAFLSRGDDFQRKARAFRRKLLRPAASNVEITFEGGATYDLEPRKLPSLFHGSPLRLYGRYRDSGPVTVRLTADVGGEQLDQVVELNLPSEEGNNPEIERMWAWHRVQGLQKEADRRGSRDSAIDEIVRLGEGFSIVTEYTSFLVLENDAEYQRWKLERRNALRLERDRRSQRALREEITRLQDEARSGLGPITPEEKAQLAQAKPRRPSNGPPSAARRQATQPVNEPPREPSRGADFDFGGGAIDPLTALLALGLAPWLVGGAVRRRR
ncbi:MAG: VIT and VWA domain-containing protein [Deltaproteobacteria bacterium]|nr:VIT and VWA domain-containing protein [Deltaproteobacteria bacterium]